MLYTGCFLHTLSSVGLSNNSRNDNFATAQKGEKPDIECRISLFDISDRINFRLRPARGRSALPVAPTGCEAPSAAIPAWSLPCLIKLLNARWENHLEIWRSSFLVVKDWDIKIKTIYKLENSIYCGVTWHFMFAPCQIYAKLAIHPRAPPASCLAMSSFFISYVVFSSTVKARLRGNAVKLFLI